MLKLLKSANPEDIFIQRYDMLCRRALSLTSNNQAQAEDLVHDVFLQFTLRRSDLGAIENTDAYLNRMLRNTYLSQVRRSSLIQDSQFSIANFDSAQLGLRALAKDPRELVEVQDELRQICHYACVRKESSKAGSVLILRFFHGYYPSEIMQVLRTSRMAVDRWLALSRREAKVYLSDPDALKFMSGVQSLNIETLGHARSAPELLQEMRETICAASQGECLSKDELKDLYRASATIDAPVLSHLVSCPPCLDTINQLLGLPLLAERSADDRLGRDVPPDHGGPGGDDQGGSGTPVMQSKRRHERRVKEVMEHRPQELRIAVNGFLLGAQQVVSEYNKQALTVNVDEPIGFVEVFSEQGLRLLFCDVDQPIDGHVEQTAHAELDCGREIDLSLSFRGPWPTINVSYHDPTFEAVESFASEVNLESASDSHADQIELDVSPPSGRPVRERTVALVCSLATGFGWRSFLRPGPVTAVFALILIAAIALLYRHVPKPTPTAADLLQRGVVSEDLIAANRDQVTHRTIRLEEKSLTGQLLASRHIEVWHSAEKAITARRLYDENGNLIAGDWRRADGVQTIYHHAKRPELKLAPDKRAGLSITFDNVWQLDPTAKEFSTLIGSFARVDDLGASYVISAEFAKSADVPGLVKASLTLSKNDLHATEQTLVIRQGDEVREFHFIEIAFDRKAPTSVAPAVFEPEPALLSSTPETRNTKPETATAGSPPTAPFLATPELELQVLKQLNQADAFYGEQISLTRTPEGRLRVQGIVETDKRKTEILQALSSVRHNPGVQIQVETVAEAAERQARQRSKSSEAVETANVEVEAKSAVPAEGDLRAYLSKQKGVSGDALDQEIRRYQDRVMAHSRQARRHALALKQIAERFSADDLRALGEGSRNQWRAMINQHARVIEQELEALRRELQLVFPSVASQGSSSNSSLSSDADLARAAKQLFELASAVDDAVGKSFSIYASGNNSAQVKTSEFASSLGAATKLAAKLSRQ